ncbi:protein mono-ADP-ribosyltransferase PARP14-like isoform X3 [Haliotis cracherodii]|uniref:protein mono-ADP-ribosyltransferase PARP14-like isoform X3 n=1 Tax=Haliotis cracherodii TaxID=6455 RepID=UPI0039ED8B95
MFAHNNINVVCKRKATFSNYALRTSWRRTGRYVEKGITLQMADKKDMFQLLPGLSAKDIDNRTVIVAPESSETLPDREALWRYFESRDESGGGALKFLDVLSDDSARLTFGDASDASNVEIRDHKVSGIRLIVYPYYRSQQPDVDLYDNRLAMSPLSEDTPTDSQQPEDTRTDSQQSEDTPKDPQKPEDSPTDSQKPEDAPTDTQQLGDTSEPQHEEEQPIIASPPLNSEELNISRGKVRYLETFPSQSLQNLVKDFVEVEYATDAFIVKGSGLDFKKKVNSLKIAILDIKEDTFEMHKRHVYGFLTSPRGRLELKKIEDRFRCAVSVDPSVYSDVKEDGEPASSIIDTDLNFTQGEIAHQRADVLVSTVDRDLDLSEGSASIAAAGGDEMQVEFRSRYPQGIKYGKVAKTKGGNLNCQEVFHCCLPEYSSDPTLKGLEKVVYKCLYDASESDYRSIALPALGTEKLGYPPDKVAKKMLTIIFYFMTYTSSLTDIAIVIGPGNSEVVTAFKQEKIKQIRNSKLNAADVPAGSVADVGFQVGKFTIHAGHGDISKESAACIAHFTNSTTPLNIGILSSPLSVACGKDLELQCQLAAGQMREKGLAMTTAPNISADIIIHIGVDRFKGNWKDVIKACLKVATENSVTSMAFPEFGTGDGKLPLEKMPKLLVKCLRDIEKKDCSLTDISFISSDATSHALFCSHLETIIGHKDTKGHLPGGASGQISATDTLPRQTGEGQQSGSIEQVFVKTTKDTEADITVYSEKEDVLRRAFKAVEDLCDIRIVTRTFEEKRLKHMVTSQMQSLKRSLESMAVDMTINWATGMVELEGVDDDVHEVESVLSRITLQAD